MAVPTDLQDLEEAPAMEEATGNFAEGTIVKNNTSGITDTVVDIDRASNTMRLQNFAPGQWVTFVGWTVIG